MMPSSTGLPPGPSQHASAIGIPPITCNMHLICCPFLAAIHCAAISAAERQAAQKLQAGADSSRQPCGSQTTPPSTSSSSSTSISSLDRPDAPVHSFSTVASSTTSVAAAPERRGISLDVPVPPRFLRARSHLAEPTVRRSMDSQLFQRSDSAVVLHEGQDVIHVLPPPDRSASKTTVRIAKRLRDMLRNLFA